MNHYAVTVLVAGLLVPAAPAPKEEDDAKALQGTWQAVTYEANGAAQKDVADHVVCTCEKDVLTFKYDGKVIWKARLKLDPSKKPKAIDLTITEGANEGQSILGIYQLDKDGLTWCTASAGAKERPTEFGTKAGSDVALYTFKKAEQ
jgi:uncharacterized protein (TIGR03067 family)